MRFAELLSLAFFVTFVSALKLRDPTESFTFKEPDNVRQLYEEFKRKYGKTYANDADEHRFEIFKNNLKQSQLYQFMDQGTAQYGITKYSDLTAEEFEKFYLNANFNQQDVRGRPANTENLPEAPDSFDWRDHGAVGPVVDQGFCGSCWAFSTIGNIEGQWFLKTKQLLQLSEQQLLDCDWKDAACHGGLPIQAYESIKRMGGLNSAEEYPYAGRALQCIMSPDRFVAYINDSVQFGKDEKMIAQWLVQNGPMSVGMNARALQTYKEGILHPHSFLCPASGLNHAVLLVGYGEEQGIPYWIVKNSWGDDFGESGYFRIYRGDGCCGINEEATSAVIF